MTVRCGALSPDDLSNELFGRAPDTRHAGDPGHLGLLASAAGGTLYLDRIDDAGPALQSHLLEFLDTGKLRRIGSPEPSTVDARVIASTVCAPGDLIEHAALRGDFVQRINRTVLTVPSLRERPEEILPLARAFASQFAGAVRPMHRKLRLALLRHDYPGNVRELRTLSEAMVVEHVGDGPYELTAELRERLNAVDPRVSQVSRLSGLDEPFRVATSGAWFEVEGERVDLSTRRSLRLLVAALAALRAEAPGTTASLDDLLAAGWPGETVIAEAGRNRVYVALTTLRKLGLRDVLVRTDDGYSFDPAIPARVEGE